MPHTLTLLHRRHGSARRMALALALGLCSAVALLLSPALASADTASSLTVVGTSDVSDSGLVPNLIGPAFIKAYPQYANFKYVGTGTGTAIADAESGAVGASVLIVHAASLENQFVAGGYSYEQYGRALFTNDFVLAGPTSDPAGVAATAPNNIAQAFANVAAAGIAGKATFVSRGGTPGTTVEEHKLWELVSNSHLAPAGLLLCAVGTASGGGETPIAAGNGVTVSGQPCPNGGALPSASQLPAWYVTTGLTQGPNVIAANACTNHPSGPSSCYVLTDRGTYDYLASGTDPAGSIPGLKIVTRDDSASAPGGADELINYFHGYIINPKKPGETVNLTAAKDFLNFVTSPAVQTEIAGYLAHTSDPGGAPFKPDASPLITASRLPRNYHAGRPVTIRGTVTNAEPGYPPLSRVPVTVDEIAGRLVIPVMTKLTNGTGGYQIRFIPPATGHYAVTTGQIAKIEIPSPALTPPFGDLLSPGASTPQKVTVYSKITKLRVDSIGNRALVYGTVAPGLGHVHAKVTVTARPAGSKGRYQFVSSTGVGSDSNNFALDARLLPGTWQVRVTFADRGVVKPTTRSFTVTTAAPTGFARLLTASVSHGRLSVHAELLPPKVAAGATVKLLVLKTTGGAPLRFTQLSSFTVPAGMNAVTLRGRLKGFGHWDCELEVTRPGIGPVYSALFAALQQPRKHHK